MKLLPWHNLLCEDECKCMRAGVRLGGVHCTAHWAHYVLSHWSTNHAQINDVYVCIYNGCCCWPGAGVIFRDSKGISKQKISTVSK